MPEPDPTPYADSAWLYRRADWEGVIPVQGKYPPPSGWTGADGLWPSSPDIQAWCEDHGNWNIALRLPPNVIGIDVDNYGDKRGAVTLADCERLWGELPGTWRSTSRTDGVSGIRLYRIPEGLRFPGQLPGGGVELIKWDHRYCMAWPSIHPEGRKYRWTRDGVTSIDIPRPEQLPLLPVPWLLALVRGQWESEPKAEIGSGEQWCAALPGAQSMGCPVMVRARHELVTRLLSGAGESRHETLNTGLLDIVRCAEQGHTGIENELRIIGAVFLDAVTSDGSRSMNTARGEWTRSINGAAARVAAAPTWPRATFDPCSGPDTPGTPGTGSTAALSGSESGSDPDVLHRLQWLRVDKQARALLLAEDMPPDEELPGSMEGSIFMSQSTAPPIFRIGSILPAGGRVVLAAQMKTGKTTFVGNLVRSLVDGIPFLGSFTVLPPVGRVTLIDNEMQSDTLRSWLRDLKIENADGFNVIPLLGRVHTFDIRIPRLFDYWVRLLSECHTSVLVIDCLKPILDALDLDEHHETGKFTTPLTRLKTEAGVDELVLVHHMGHANERSRGDSALRGWPEVEWHLVRLAENPDIEAEMDAPRFFKAYGRDVNYPESQLIYDPLSRDLTLKSGTRKDAKADGKADALRAGVIEVVRTNPGISSTKMITALRSLGVSFRNGAEVKVCADLVHETILKVVNLDHGGKAFYLQALPPFPGIPRDSPNDGSVLPPRLRGRDSPMGDDHGFNFGEGG